MDNGSPDINTKPDDRLLHAIELRSHEYGDEIIREGDESPCFFVILNGQVGISKSGRLIRVLEDHDVFGLETILLKRGIPYSARSMRKTRLARYAPEALDHCLRENPQMTTGILRSTLQQLVQTTARVTEDTEAFTLDDAQVEFFRDGEAIVVEGMPGRDFFRLVSTQGGLRVTREGKELYRIDKPGEFFGEMAGLLKLPRQATITSIGDSVVERYGGGDLEAIIRYHPEVALQIMHTVISRLIDVGKKYTEVLV